MTPADPSAEDFVYDEFAYFDENLADVGLTEVVRQPVERIHCDVESKRSLSGLLWGHDPELVFIHGTAQNAHTWDTVVLALGRSALAVDLAGHGHSDWREDRGYSPRNLADDIAVMMKEVAPNAKAVVGMSLGGMVAISLVAHHQDLVQRLITIDVTPGVTREKAKHIHDFISGPQSFASFAEIFDRTVEFNPTRSASSLRRGIVHNAYRREDGSWQWRYDRRGPDSDAPVSSPTDLWVDVEAVTTPYLLVRGGAEGSVVDDVDVAELVRRQPDAEVLVVPDAGHSIQSDEPVELARIIDEHVRT